MRFISLRVYRYPVGLLGLQIRMPRVRSLISFSNSSIGGSANPFSMEATTGRITAPAEMAKAM